MVQAQTKRVGTVEEYVAVMESVNNGRYTMLLDCEVTGSKCQHVEGMINRGRLFYFLRCECWSISEETMANIVKAYTQVKGDEIRLCLSIQDAETLFGDKDSMAMLKRVIGDAKHVISVVSL